MSLANRSTRVILNIVRQHRKGHLLCYRRSNNTIVDVLEQVRRGEVSSEQGFNLIASIWQLEAYERSMNDQVNLFANIDHGRSKRTGFPEAVFSEGKTPFQVAAILDDMALNFRSEREANVAVFKPIIATRYEVHEVKLRCCCRE